jgi:hypothetical protein
MTSQNIHLPSVGVNCLVAGAYYYIKQKKFLPAVGGLILSSIVQGYRPPVPFKQRNWESDIKVLTSAALIGLGFAFSKTSFKIKLISGLILFASQVCVKELFTMHAGNYQQPNLRVCKPLEQKIMNWAAEARCIRPGPVQRFDQMALFGQAFQACKDKLGVAKAEALTWVYQQFNPLKISFGDQIRNDLIELIQEASADEQDSYYREIHKIAALENVHITTLFSICEAFIAKFYSAEEGVDNTVGDALLLYEDLIHSRLKDSDQAIASVQYLTFLDSQGLQNCTFFEDFRDRLGKTYKQSWLSREGHAIYQRWRQQ